MATGIKVFAPASVANLACGYDILGLALERPGDEIIIRKTDGKGLKINKIFGADRKLPTDIHKNTAGLAAYALLKSVDRIGEGIEMDIYKKMPSGSGLGSSAASAAAAVWGINALLDLRLTKRELLHFAVLGEQAADGSYHADNVAPSLMGGIIFIRDNESLDIHKLPPIPGLYLAMVHPAMTIMTKDARDIIKPNVALEDHIHQSGNVGGLIIGFYTSDIELIKRSLNDVIIEPQRASLIDHFYEVKEAALNAGALGCSISGAGPSMFALCSNSIIAEEVSEAMSEVFKRNNIKSHPFISRINQEGAIII